MTPGFVVLGLLTVAGAIAAVTLRNLVHCALAVAVSFAGLAAIYVQLDAQFVGFAQVLIYIGAVAILILFAVLLTRGAEPGSGSMLSSGWFAGAVLACAVFFVVSGTAIRSRVTGHNPVHAEPTVRQVGEVLMSKYVVSLQIAGLLLTAALIGAVVLAMHQTGTTTQSSEREGEARDHQS